MSLEDWVHGYKLLPFSPKRRLYRRIVLWVERARNGRRSNKVGTIPIKGTRAIKLNLNLDIWLQRECYYFNTFELFVSNFIKSVLKDGDKVIDIGANIGYYTLICSRLVGSKGHVFAFEPSSKFYGQLEQNIALNGLKNISTYKLAVGCDNSPQTLMTGSQSASIVLGDPKKEQVTSEVVDSTTLDQFIAQQNYSIKLLKVDVDGWDYNVLLGATNLLREIRPFVIVEVIDWGITTPSHIFHFLKEHNYDVFFEQDLTAALTALDFDKLVTKLHGLNVIGIPRA